MHERTTVRKKTGLRTQMMTLMLILCTLALLIQGCLLIYASVRFYSEKAYDDMEFFLQTCNSNFSSKMLYVEGVVNNLRGDPMMQSFFSDEGFNWVEIRSQFEFCTNIVSEQNLIDSREPFVSEIYLFNGTEITCGKTITVSRTTSRRRTTGIMRRFLKPFRTASRSSATR